MGDRVKIIALITGMFLGTYSSPICASASFSHLRIPLTWCPISATMVGIDAKNNTYVALGDANKRFSTTAEIDIARSVAQLAVLSLDPATTASVPSDVIVAPVTVSYAEFAETVSRVRGVPKTEVVVEDLKAFKEELSRHPAETVFDYIRCVTTVLWKLEMS